MLGALRIQQGRIDEAVDLLAAALRFGRTTSRVA